MHSRRSVFTKFSMNVAVYALGIEVTLIGRYLTPLWCIKNAVYLNLTAELKRCGTEDSQENGSLC